MSETRPDPDQLLERVQAQEAKAKRGKLKVFFGACAGVGKTYGMLLEGRERLREGRDVVIGYVEPHGRSETELLAVGVPQIPTRSVEYRGTSLREFDLDAALARKPGLLLLDELAHTNAPGSRHAKRWQDAEELLDAGIDIYTTVNVQHLESLNDIVAQFTGVRTAETVPDRVFEQADEVELIDQPPDDLLQRLREGKIYLPEQARNAIENFFRKGNLIALRELALRTTADRVDAAMREYRSDQAIRETWATRERLLVCVGPDEQAERLVRAARRLATALHAEWITLYVETPQLLRLSEQERNRRIEVLRLAESLGAEAVTLGGASVADEVLNYARTRNVTRILIGRPTRSAWLRLLRPSTVDTLIDRSGDIDVQVVTGDEAALARRNPVLLRTSAILGVPSAPTPGKKRWPGYAWAVLSTAVCSAIAWPMTPAFELANLIMLYLLGVVVIALRFGRGPAVTVAILNVVVFDFVFVPPRLTFAVADVQYLLTFAIMLVVALVVANLTASVRLQAKVAGHRERRTAMLYAMSRELTATRGLEALAQVAVRHTSEVFDSQVVVLLPDANGRIGYPAGPSQAASYRGADLSIAQWVCDHGKVAGLGTDTLPGAEGVYLPLSTSGRALGVLAVLPANPRHVLLPEQFHLLETFAAQISAALERASLAEAAEGARLKAETEELRNSLLSAISHDLRTPLAVIAGAASGLLEKAEQLSPGARADLARTVYDEAQQMSQLIGNLLDMTRLESGTAKLNREWLALDELVGSALRRMGDRLGERSVQVTLPPDLPLLLLDGVLIEQVLVNLLDNIIKYTPRRTSVWIRASVKEAEVIVAVADNGPGLPPGEETLVFEKFHRGSTESAIGGAGLGLTICRAIVQAHGGRIWAEPRLGGGVTFRFSLPFAGEAPVLVAEAAEASS